LLTKDKIEFSPLFCQPVFLPGPEIGKIAITPPGRLEKPDRLSSAVPGRLKDLAGNRH
jgi:hypothetical protein